MFLVSKSNWYDPTLREIGWRHGIASDKLMFHINTDIVLVPVVIDALILTWRESKTLYSNRFEFFIPAIWHAASARYEDAVVDSDSSHPSAHTSNLVHRRTKLAINGYEHHC